jgi:hypothetical protein
MNKSLLTHGAWLGVAAAAFAGGMTIKGDSGNADSDSANRGSGSSASSPSAITSAKRKADQDGTKGTDTGATGSAAAFGVTKSTTALLADYLSSNDKLEQNLLFAQLLVGITPENAAQIHESLKGKLTGSEGGQQMSLFFQAWGKVDGESAIAAASEGGIQMGRGGGNGFNVGGVLAGWATSDPEAAKTWLGELEDDRSKGFLTFGLINGLAQSDPNAATDYVLELAAAETANGGEAQQTPWGGSFSSRYIDMIADEQLKLGTGVATAWAEGLPEGDMKESAFDQLAENMSRTDLDGAKAWIAEHAGADYAGDAVREVAERISRDDPQAALTWADSLPETAQAGVYREAMGTWTREDPTAASQYLATLDNSPNRDAAVGSFATSLARARDEEQRDPESAASWAITIEDETVRTDTVTEVARSWMRSDREAATAWLPSSGLSAEAQAEVAAPREDRGGFDDRRRGR